MTDKTKLQAALRFAPISDDGHMDTLYDAAQTLLSLYEHHDIQALIDGKAEIVKAIHRPARMKSIPDLTKQEHVCEFQASISATTKEET